LLSDRGLKHVSYTLSVTLTNNWVVFMNVENLQCLESS
jgi:hypothetical protein